MFAIISFIFCIGVVIFYRIKNKRKYKEGKVLFKGEKQTEEEPEYDISDYVDNEEYNYSAGKRTLSDDDIAPGCIEDLDEDNNDDDDDLIED